MASYYVWSGAAGTGSGANWANAFTTLTLAFSGHAAGDTYYVAHDHAETGTNISYATLGTVAVPTKIICVDRGGTVPPVSADRRATATVTPSGTMTFASGHAHFDGIIFNAGGSTAFAATGVVALWLRFDNCSLRCSGAGSQKFSVGNNSTTYGVYVEFNNTTFSFNSLNHAIDVAARIRWRNTPSAILGSTLPTNLFNSAGFGFGGDVECIGVDLSALGSGKNLVSGSGGSNTGGACRFRFVDCKLNASVTKSVVPGNHSVTEVDFVRSGSAGTNYTVHSHRISGLLIEETTIVRTGGANDGTTAIAWKIVTTANCTYSIPFECPPIAVWNDTTGSAVTATVEGVWGGGAVPLDDEIWLDVEYLSDASSPQGAFVSGGKANLLTAAANQTSSSETWGGSTTEFKLAASFTPQQKGWVYARVKCARPSSTFYIDPLVVLS